jgi:hypothetical protein
MWSSMRAVLGQHARRTYYCQEAWCDMYSKLELPIGDVSAGIFKQFMGASNQVGLPLESILGLLKSLKIRALACLFSGWQHVLGKSDTCSRAGRQWAVWRACVAAFISMLFVWMKWGDSCNCWSTIQALVYRHLDSRYEKSPPPTPHPGRGEAWKPKHMPHPLGRRCICLLLHPGTMLGIPQWEGYMCSVLIPLPVGVSFCLSLQFSCAFCPFHGPKYVLLVGFDRACVSRPNQRA